MKRIVTLIVTLLLLTSVYSETLPVEEIVNIPASFTDITGDYYDECPHAQDWCIYYDNVFGAVYHPETDANGYLVENFFSSHDIVKEIFFHPQSQATTIGRYAFCYLAALQSMTFPQGITSIDSYAFQGTQNISTVNVYVTDPDVFSDNQVVGQIRYSLNKPVTLIDSGGNEITEFVIPDGVESVGANAFSNCAGLTSVTFPDGLTSIGASAFEGCTALTSVTIPESVSSIGGNAFPPSTEIWVPKGMKGYFQNLLGANYKVFETGMQISTYNHVIYALDKDSHTAEAVGVSDNTLSSYSMPKQFILSGVRYMVTAINNSAFKDCPNMTEVNIPLTVTDIGSYAFAGCASLTTVDIPESVTSISDYTFNDCTSLASVSIPSTMTGIGRNAFAGCTGLTKVIAADMAAWCNISFSNYYANPLAYAHHLYSDDSTEITDLVIPEGVTHVNAYAFTDDSGLTSVTIPSSVTNIGSYAFTGCNGVKTVTMNSNAVMSRYYMNSIFGKDVENYVIGGDVTAIRSNAFSGCTRLKSVNVSPTVTSIGNDAFYGCSGLQNIMIPEGITNIGSYAFNGCSLLTDIYNFNPQPQTINSNTFSNYGATLYVLESSVGAYRAADVWKQFNIEGVLKGDVNKDHKVNVTDFLMLANELLGLSPIGLCHPLADVAGGANGGPDGKINIIDWIGISNIILNSGSE